MKTKLHIILSSILGPALLVFAGGCASDLKVTNLPPVGPDSGRVPGAKTPGYLIVYTATENPINATDGGLMYYPHTSYTVYDSRGAKVRWVPNHISSSDESPSRVILPAGDYVIRAESEIDGPVRVPVIVRGLRTTVVNLEKRSHDTQES